MKKIILRILLAALILTTLIFSGAFIFVAFKGKQAITARLSSLLGKKVDIGQIQVLFPLGLRFRNFNVDGYGQADEVYANLGVFYLLSNHLAFGDLVLTRPRVTIQRTKDSRVIFGSLPGAENQSASGPASQTPVDAVSRPGQETEGTRVPLRFSAERLIVRNGTVDFVDYSIGNTPFRITLRNIDFRLRDAGFPLGPGKTRFDCRAFLVLADASSLAGKIEGRGWVDFARKDMQAKLTVSDLDGKVFSPYYGESLNSDLQHIVVDLSVDLESRRNDMAVRGKLVTKDFILNAQKDKELSSFSVENLILGGLQSAAKEIVIDFKFKTKMDDFKIESISFSGNVFNQAPTNENKDSTKVQGSLVK